MFLWAAGLTTPGWKTSPSAGSQGTLHHYRGHHQASKLKSAVFLPTPQSPVEESWWFSAVMEPGVITGEWPEATPRGKAGTLGRVYFNLEMCVHQVGWPWMIEGSPPTDHHLGSTCRSPELENPADVQFVPLYALNFQLQVALAH